MFALGTGYVGPAPQAAFEVGGRLGHVAAARGDAHAAPRELAPPRGRLADKVPRHAHVVRVVPPTRGVADLVRHLEVVAPRERVADGVLDRVLVRGVAQDVAVECLQARALAQVAVEREGAVGVVLLEAADAAVGVAQLAQRAEGAQRRVLVHRHLVAKGVALAVDERVARPDLGRHGAAVARGLLAVLVPPVVHARVGPALARLEEEGLLVERRGHRHPVAVVVAPEVVGAAPRALRAVGARAREVPVAAPLDKGLAREAEHAREARLHHARAERVLVVVVRRRQEGRGHRVRRHEVERAVALAVGAVVETELRAGALRRLQAERGPELLELLAQQLHARRVVTHEGLVSAKGHGRRRRRRARPVPDHARQLPLDLGQEGLQLVVLPRRFGTEGVEGGEHARDDGLVEAHRGLVDLPLRADVLRGRVHAGRPDAAEDLLHRRRDDLGRVLEDVLEGGLELVDALVLEEGLVPLKRVVTGAADVVDALKVALALEALLLVRRARQVIQDDVLGLRALLDLLLVVDRGVRQADGGQGVHKRNRGRYAAHHEDPRVDVQQKLDVVGVEEADLVEQHHHDVAHLALGDRVVGLVEPRGADQPHDLAHARRRVEADGRELQRAGHVVHEGVHGPHERGARVVRARRVAQRARRGRGQAAPARAALEGLALVLAVEGVAAREALQRLALERGLLLQHAREEQADLGDAHVVHVIVDRLDDDAAEERRPPEGAARAAGHREHRLRAASVCAARVQVVEVRVGAHAVVERHVVRVVARLLHQVEVLVVGVREPHAAVLLARRLERIDLGAQLLVRLVAVPGDRVQLHVLGAHVVLARDGVRAAAAEAVEVVVAADHEALPLRGRAVLVEGGHVLARGRFAVRAPARDGCEQDAHAVSTLARARARAQEQTAANIGEAVAKRRETRGHCRCRGCVGRVGV